MDLRELLGGTAVQPDELSQRWLKLVLGTTTLNSSRGGQPRVGLLSRGPGRWWDLRSFGGGQYNKRVHDGVVAA